jgi:AcrR family transcriptional regulator
VSDDLKSRPGARSAAKRELIVDAAMRHFAEHGYQGARVEDIAAELQIAKGSIFQHFGSKAGLFLAAYRKAVASLPAWLDAPREVVGQGFWAVLTYWLERTEHLVQEDWVPYRVTLIGNYGTDLALKREINRHLVSEDPYGTLEFVEYGVRRGEVRADIDLEMAASMVDWLTDRFQDALVTAELDPGLFHRHPNEPQRRALRMEQFVDLLRRAIGTAP